MDIYFSASIAGGMEDAGNYREIMYFLKRHGQVLTEHLWNENLHANLAKGIYPPGMEYLKTEQGTFRQDIEWIWSSQLVVAEVSTPSLGVGYEIAYAQLQGIPVICLYREGSPRRLSSMIAGNDHLTVIHYQDLPGLFGMLGELIEEVKGREVANR